MRALLSSVKMVHKNITRWLLEKNGLEGMPLTTIVDFLS